MTRNKAWRRASIALAAATVSLASLPASSHGAQIPPFGLATAVPNVNSSAPDGCPIESPDGLSLFFASARPDVPGNVGNDIWVADRESVNSPWQPPRNIGEPVNSLANDFCP